MVKLLLLSPLCAEPGDGAAAQHLFLECPFSCSVWKSVDDWCHCHSFDPVNWTTVEDLPSWFHNLIGALSGAQAVLLTGNTDHLDFVGREE